MDALYEDAVGVLAAAQALLTRPGTWTKGALACDAVGHPCWPISPRAQRWCLTGAIDRGLLTACHAAPDEPARAAAYVRYDAVSTLIHRSFRDCLGVPIGTWNDAPEREHADVLRALAFLRRILAAVGMADE